MAVIIVSPENLDDYILTLEIALQNLPAHAAPGHAKRLRDLIDQLKHHAERAVKTNSSQNISQEN